VLIIDESAVHEPASEIGEEHGWTDSHAATVQLVREVLGKNLFVIEAKQVAHILALTGLEIGQLLQASLIDRAIEAAYMSYAPYSKSLAGVSVRTKDGSIYVGSYLENAAFNPSLSPFHCALIALVADQKRYEDIVEMILVEQKAAKISHAILSEANLKNIAPQAQFFLKEVD